MDNSSRETISLYLAQAHSVPGSHVYIPSVDLLSPQMINDYSSEQSKWHQYTLIHQPPRYRK